MLSPPPSGGGTCSFSQVRKSRRDLVVRFFPVSVWCLALSFWSISPHASHLMLPSCPPPSHDHLKFALFFRSNFKLVTFPSFYLGQQGCLGSPQILHFLNPHSASFFPKENTGRFTQQFNVTVLPFLLVSNRVAVGCLWVEFGLGPKATVSFPPLPIPRPFCYCSNP